VNNAYWRKKEKLKKSKQRADQSLLLEVHNHLVEKAQPHDPAFKLVSHVLEFYHSNEIKFPTKSTMDSILLRFMYVNGRSSEVAAYYSKNFPEY